MPARTLARHLVLLDVYGVNNICIGPMHMNIGQYLEASSAKRDTAGI